jgi:hypothetical protein
MSGIFPIQNGLKQVDAFSLFVLNFAFEDTIRQFQENQVGTKINGTSASGLCWRIKSIGGNKYHRENQRSFKEVGMKVNIEETRSMQLYCDQNAGPNHNIKEANRSSENVAQFKCL